MRIRKTTAGTLHPHRHCRRGRRRTGAGDTPGAQVRPRRAGRGHPRRQQAHPRGEPKLHEIAAGSMDIGDHEVSLPGAGALAWLPLPHRADDRARPQPARDPRRPFSSMKDGKAVTPRVPSPRHAGDRGRQSQQRFRHAGGARACAQAQRPSPMRGVFHAHGQCVRARPRPAFAAAPRAVACGDHRCPALPASSFRQVTTPRARWWRTGWTASMPKGRPAHPDRSRAARAAWLARAPVAIDRALAAQAGRGSEYRRTRGRGAARWRAPGRRSRPARRAGGVGGRVKARFSSPGSTGWRPIRINQLVVRQTLQSSVNDDIFAMGDCAACPWPERTASCPARAGHAHQQALASGSTQLQRRLAGKAGAGLPLPGLRFAGVAGRVQHGGQHDGRARQGRPVHRGLVRA